MTRRTMNGSWLLAGEASMAKSTTRRWQSPHPAKHPPHHQDSTPTHHTPNHHQQDIEPSPDAFALNR